MLRSSESHPPRFFSAVAALVILAGCASSPSPEPKASDIGELLNKTLASPGGVVAAGGDAVTPATPPRTVGGVVSMRYSGDAATLLAQVADARGISFRVTGPFPRIPLFVSYSGTNVPFEEFLREIGGQFGQRADVAPINGSYKNGIEIRYRNH